MVKTKPSGMRIIFFTDGLLLGGKERRLTQLMKALNLRSDISFDLVVMNKNIEYQEVFNLKSKIHYLIRGTKKDLTIFHKFYRICKNYKPDIVHCWDSMTAIFAIPACKFLNIALINGMVADTPVKQNIFNKYWLRAKLTFPFSTKIIANSNAGLIAYRAPRKKSSCVRNGMDLARFKNLKEPSLMRQEIFGAESDDDIFIIGMVAAFEKRKDYKTLIEAAISLISSYEKIRFILIGNGTDFNATKEMVPGHLLNKIIFLGKQSDIESTINIFNVGVLLTNIKVHGEGISNSILEYMALSKPVIATRGGGTNEVVFENHNGYLIDAGNKDQLIEKIEMLMKDKTRTAELGNNGNQMVHKQFDLQIMANNYTIIYKQLLKEK